MALAGDPVTGNHRFTTQLAWISRRRLSKDYKKTAASSEVITYIAKARSQMDAALSDPGVGIR